MSRHTKTTYTGPLTWTHRLKNGVLRAQCKACFEAGLQPLSSIHHCPTCAVRNEQRREEIDVIGLEELEQAERNRRHRVAMEKRQRRLG